MLADKIAVLVLILATVQNIKVKTSEEIALERECEKNRHEPRVKFN